MRRLNSKVIGKYQKKYSILGHCHPVFFQTLCKEGMILKEPTCIKKAAK